MRSPTSPTSQISLNASVRIEPAPELRAPDRSRGQHSRSRDPSQSESTDGRRIYLGALAAMQRSAPKETQPAVAAAICLLGAVITVILTVRSEMKKAKAAKAKKGA